MKKLVFISFLLFGCKSLEYPVVTRYREGRVKYVRLKEIKQKQNKHKNKTKRDIYIFTIGTFLGFYYISNAK